MKFISLLVFLFVFAASAPAQWQTKVDFMIFSLSDHEYRGELEKAKNRAIMFGKHREVANLQYVLGKGDPDGYKLFAIEVVHRLIAWRDSEMKKGEKCSFRGRAMTIALTPYGINLMGDVQITVVWLNAVVGDDNIIITRASSARMNNGVDAVVKNIIGTIVAPLSEEPQPVQPTSRKSA